MNEEITLQMAETPTLLIARVSHSTLFKINLL